MPEDLCGQRLHALKTKRKGLDARSVLRAAAKEGRIVVTEDVTTFAAAIAVVADHVGVVYCHHARYPPRAAPPPPGTRDAVHEPARRSGRAPGGVVAPAA